MRNTNWLKKILKLTLVKCALLTNNFAFAEEFCINIAQVSTPSGGATIIVGGNHNTDIVVNGVKINTNEKSGKVKCENITHKISENENIDINRVVINVNKQITDANNAKANK